MLICPICNEILSKSEKTYSCSFGHFFDISKTSHINLLISNKDGNKFGDNKEMVRARTDFLNKDFYLPLATKICEILPNKSNISLLDSGCGEGYYTSKISKFLENSSVFATDISKHAIIHASKVDKNTTYLVGSVFNLPLKSSSIDIVTSIFAPLACDEFHRILKDDGTFIAVVSGKNHLLELKQAIYDKAYLNDEDKYDFKDFSILAKEKLTYTVNIAETSDIKQLFSMTPYAFKTSISDIKKLDLLSNLDLTLDFMIYILKK